MYFAVLSQVAAMLSAFACVCTLLRPICMHAACMMGMLVELLGLLTAQ